jgi:hypothetical protein
VNTFVSFFYSGIFEICLMGGISSQKFISYAEAGIDAEKIVYY